LSEIRLYFDEDAMQSGLVGALSARGVAVTTPLPARSGWSDDQQLTFAAENGWVLYTFNEADFCRLHGTWLARERHHAGIIIAPQQRFSIGEQLRRLLRIYELVRAEEMKDRIEFLSNWGRFLQ
jgi:hypothetical protein